MGFGNLGVSELLVLAVLVLVFFGPRRIPEVARTVGSALREFQRGWNEIRRELEDVERDVTGGAPPPRRRGPERRRPGETAGAWDEDGGDGERESPPAGRVRPGEREEAGADDAGDEAGGDEEDVGADPDQTDLWPGEDGDDAAEADDAGAEDGEP